MASQLPKSPFNLSSLSNILNFCTKLHSLSLVKQVQSHLLKLGYHHHTNLYNHLLNAYVKHADVSSAYQLLVKMPKRNVVSWNIILSGLSDSAHCVECLLSKTKNPGTSLSLQLLRGMLLERLEPDQVTLVSILKACLHLGATLMGKQVHCYIVKHGYSSDNFVGGTVMNLYGKNGLMEDACCAFAEIQKRDLVVWNGMLSCYAQNGYGAEIFKTFKSMSCAGILGDSYTYCTLVNACSKCLCYEVLGWQVHCLVIKFSFDFDIFTATALIDMYAKNGNMEAAQKVFNLMSSRNVVSWNTVIVGHAKNDHDEIPLTLFKEMLQSGSRPDELTHSAILGFCAKVAVNYETIQIHAHVVKSGTEVFTSVVNALVNAYSRCGSMSSAVQSFTSIPVPDLVTWTILISSYAFNGHHVEALLNFEKMLSQGLKPDGIVYLAVLSACSHSGMVDLGLRYLSSMIYKHQITLTIEHVACLVDMLGRAGYLDEAFDVLCHVPFKITESVLGAFLNACKVHRNIGLGKWAADKLFSIEPNDPVNYMLMSNIYADVGCWDDVTKVRKMTDDKGFKKVSGCSWIEIGGTTHVFVSKDISHPNSAAVYFMMKLVTSFLKLEGYTAESSCCYDE